jgi:hypothetical protein
MLRACSYTICLVFCYTLWRFYAFSGTNLLTRCHSASFLFSGVFVFQKSYTGNILGIGRNKSRTFYYLTKLPEVRRGDGGGHRAATPPGGAACPWPTSGAAPSPMMTPRRENLNTRSIFQKHIAIRHRHRPEIGRVRKLFLAPCRRGELPPEVFFIAMLAYSAMRE